MSGVVFLDTETTGLDPDRHEIWELAIIDDQAEHEWRFLPDLTRADPTGLRIGRFYQRTTAKKHEWADPYAAALSIAPMLDGKHIVGAVPSFDAAFLQRFLRRNGQAATWHYHLIDIEALAVGYLAHRGVTTFLPWDSEQLSGDIGVNPEDFDRHTALGDARWAKAIYEKVMGG